MNADKFFLIIFFLLALLSVVFVFDKYLIHLVNQYLGSNFDSKRNFFWGIDIAGGSILTYEVDNKTTSTAFNKEILEQTKDLLERRINFLGVQESFVSYSQNGKFIITLPNITSTDEAIKIIGDTPLLEFRVPVFVTSSANVSKNALATTTEDIRVFFLPSGLTGKDIEKAYFNIDFNTNKPVVNLVFNRQGAILFRELTEKYLNQPIAIFLDGELLSQPIVKAVITNGEAVISADNFTIDEAQTLARRLNQGSLPVPLKLISVSTINPTLGDNFFNISLKLSIIGIVLVMFFMIIIYGFNGIIADIALLFFIIFNLALYKFLGVTISLASISGLVLAIGMAVDANILIFERFREEKKLNKTKKDLIIHSFNRAFTSIRDSNFTTLIASLVIYLLASSFVKGFALTLFFGTLISFITAVFFTKNLLLIIYKNQ